MRGGGKAHPARHYLSEQERLLCTARDAAIAVSKAVLCMEELSDHVQGILRTIQSPELQKVMENLRVHLESLECVERDVHHFYGTLVCWPSKVYLC